jgi:hypothetical protein
MPRSTSSAAMRVWIGVSDVFRGSGLVTAERASYRAGSLGPASAK